jgi:hypothetical protein
MVSPKHTRCASRGKGSRKHATFLHQAKARPERKIDRPDKRGQDSSQNKQAIEQEMYVKILAPMALAVVLSACAGNPLGNVEETTTDTGTGTGTGTTDTGGITSDLILPPGTESPTRDTTITRYEAEDGNGSGFVTDVTYSSGSDTFTVDNLAFDGAGAYTRGSAVGSLGPFAVYEGPSAFVDTQSGTTIPQFLHRAIYGVSPSGQTEFAIVRTGSFVDYGFGGFIYQRNVSVTLPQSGQAAYAGKYAGLRDFATHSGIEFTSGDMNLFIDFDDFNNGAGVRGYVYNRAIFDVNGDDVTDDVLAALTEDSGVSQTVLPTLVFSVAAGVMDANGEMTGGVSSSYTDDGGATQVLETGNYYGIVAGDDAEEIVGMIVVTSTDPRDPGGEVRETGGFIVYRPVAP